MNHEVHLRTSRAIHTSLGVGPGGSAAGNTATVITTPQKKGGGKRMNLFTQDNGIFPPIR